MAELREWRDLPHGLLVVVSKTSSRAASRAIRELIARIRLAEAQNTGTADEQVSANLRETTPLYRALGQIVYNHLESLPAKERLEVTVDSMTHRERRSFIDVLAGLTDADEQREESNG